MLTCHCGKEFENYRQLNGHKGSHNREESYMIGRRKSPVIYNCVYCGKENNFGHSKENKYCGPDCQRDFQWKFVTIPRIENGEATHNSVPSLKRYLKEKFGDTCNECGQNSTWNSKPLTLQLDHIDGNSDNNLPGNLRLLCPNCHTQTDTFGSKGKGSRYKKVSKRNVYLKEYRGG
jgi:hypothetical protein